MLIGYARVSTADQNADHQVDTLLPVDVAERDIHLDITSGARASRPKLDLVMQLPRAGAYRPVWATGRRYALVNGAGEGTYALRVRLASVQEP